MLLKLDDRQVRALKALIYTSMSDERLDKDLRYEVSTIIPLITKGVRPLREEHYPYILTKDYQRKDLDSRLTPEVIDYLFS